MSVRLLRLAAGGALALAFAASAAVVSAQSGGGSVTACVSAAGIVRLVAAGESCRAAEQLVVWSVEGPQGPAGPEGPEGPQGPTGPEGPAGPACTPGATPPPLQAGLLTIGSASSAIYSFSFGATAPISSGGGGAAGRTTLSDIAVTKAADALSRSLFSNVVRGVHMPTVQIDIYEPGTTTVVASYGLQDILISSFAAASGGNGQLESVSFNYRVITVTSGGSSFCWNIAENAAC